MDLCLRSGVTVLFLKNKTNLGLIRQNLLYRDAQVVNYLEQEKIIRCRYRYNIF